MAAPEASPTKEQRVASEDDTRRPEAAAFTQMLQGLWQSATLASRSQGGLPTLPPSQAWALRRVIAAERITPTQLAADMKLSRPMVSEVISKLEENKLVSRRRSKHDGRSTILTATDHGRYVHEHFRMGLEDAVTEAFEALPKRDVNRITSDLPVLSRLLEHLAAIAAREEEAAASRARH